MTAAYVTPATPRYAVRVCPQCRGWGTIAMDLHDYERDEVCPLCSGKCEVVVEIIELGAIQ